MCGNMACVAAILLGIDVGWQPLPDGGLLYLIQIEPELIGTLESGQPVESDFPSYVKDVRGFRITVGSGQLPRELPPMDVPSPGAGAAVENQPPADPFLPPPAAPSSWPNALAELPSLRQPGTESPNAPKVIQPAPDSKRIGAQPAGYLEQPTPPPERGESKSPSDQEPGREEIDADANSKPWTPLIVTLFTLFGSLGANFYLGWITWNTRSRYRSAIEGKSLPELQ